MFNNTKFSIFREPLQIHFVGQANLFAFGRRQIKAALALTKAGLSFLPEYKKILLAAQKQLLELPFILATILIIGLPCNVLAKEDLLSSTVAEKLYETARELANSDKLDSKTIDTAMVFYNSALKLDRTTAYILPDMLSLASQFTEEDNSHIVLTLLDKYVKKDCDLIISSKAVKYLLLKQNTREEKEALLNVLLQKYGSVNDAFASELYTELGLLAAEKPDPNTAVQYLAQANKMNKYNRLALAKLTELQADAVSPQAYLGHLRLRIVENPYDINAALSYADYARGLNLFDIAAGTYQYCADLYKSQFPGTNLPVDIYIPWAICCYNHPAYRSQCHQILSEVKSQGTFEFILESLVVLLLSTDTDLSQQKLSQLEQSILDHIKSPNSAVSDIVSLAYFYCFVCGDKEKAINAANKAFSLDPNSQNAAAILAYSLAMDGSYDFAADLLENYASSQVSKLALALIQINKPAEADANDAAIRTLNQAIAMSPGTLVAHKAHQLLAEFGQRYIPPVDETLVLTALKQNLSVSVIPEFNSSLKPISVELDLKSGQLSYPSDLGDSITIINNSSQPIVVTDYSFFKGYIRIDAKVTGDITRTIPSLVDIRIKPSSVIELDSSYDYPITLNTGILKKLLFAHPQAKLNIDFMVYLDPVIDGTGAVTASVPFEPFVLKASRSPIQLSTRFLRNRLSSITTGQTGQRINTAILFAGLLAEQDIMANSEPLYEFSYAKWMPGMLKAGLVDNLTQADWITRAVTLNVLVDVPLDYELTEAVAQNLYHQNWPVRLLATYLLAQKQGDKFTQPLISIAQNDPSVNVKNLASILAGLDNQVDLKPSSDTLTSPATNLNLNR